MTPAFSDLAFGSWQLVLLVVLCALAAGIVAVFVVVAVNSTREVPFAQVQRVGYWIRKRWFRLLLTLLVVVVGASLFELPYAAGGDAKTVRARAVGAQFAWTIAPQTFKAGSRVRFSVTSADVNHGFGLYDPDGQLIGSVQAMPGYTNKLTVTFDKPGRYVVACLEFCGVRHHVMESAITVTGG